MVQLNDKALDALMRVDDRRIAELEARVDRLTAALQEIAREERIGTSMTLFPYGHAAKAVADAALSGSPMRTGDSDAGS